MAQAVRRGIVRVVRGPRENNHRPAISQRRAVLWTAGDRHRGALDDGAAGLFAIKSRGGAAIVQDSDDALFPEMPVNAMSATPVDYSAPKDQIAKLIIKLVGTTISIEPRTAMDDGRLKKESDIVVMENSAIEDDKPGTPSVCGCPECGGTLWELQDDKWLRFRCGVGNAFSVDGTVR